MLTYLKAKNISENRNIILSDKEDATKLVMFFVGYLIKNINSTELLTLVKEFYLKENFNFLKLTFLLDELHNYIVTIKNKELRDNYFALFKFISYFYVSAKNISDNDINFFYRGLEEKQC
jgi:hypothetical protein